MSRRKRIILAVVVALLLAGCWVGYKLYYFATVAVVDAYALWWVADMVVEHMESHGGAWPRDWEDLREPYAICVRRSGEPWSFDLLRDRVVVDFTADPKALAEVQQVREEPPFQVIYLKNGKHHWWSGHEPNAVILRYLREKAGRRDSERKAHSRP